MKHRPTMDILSKSHIGLVDRWRHTCEMQHRSCNEATFNQILPSRVLELLDPSDEKKGARLTETQNKMQGTYACLSYCWGSFAQTGRTTRGNLSSHLEAIPFHELPDTVIDTIRLCYKLGFRYLWVDRLCIVQDDHEDWSAEASKMCDIYSRSALTISAPVCKESSQSFLTERRKGFREQSQFATVSYFNDDSKLKGSFWFYQDHLARTDGPWFLEYKWEEFCGGSNYEENRWLERGWTFQEWMLSPRVLHIDSITLWDCFEGYANEIQERHMSKANLVRNPTRYGPEWEEIVREYSQRNVTRGEDRLPALAGLAAREGQATGHTYLAGIWREDLPMSLLWGRSPNCKQPGNPNKDLPSWTWASVNGAVFYMHAGGKHSFSPKASILSVFCQYDPPESFWAVKKAWIDIECRVSIVTEQDEENVKVGGEWWMTMPDHGDKYADDAIAQGKVYMLVLARGELIFSDLCGSLVLQACGWDDGRPCFRRLGFAMKKIFKEDKVQSPELGLSWETRVIRLV